MPIAEYQLPPNHSEQGIVSVPDGDIWFTDIAGNIGQINPTTHHINLHPIPTTNGSPEDITLGPDGNLWFTESAGNKIGRINPTTGFVDEFTIPTADSFPVGITEGPDQNLWFTERVSGKIGKINPYNTQQISDYPATAFGDGPTQIAVGFDNNLWFTEENSNDVGRINPTTGSVTPFTFPGDSGSSIGITADPLGNLWITCPSANAIGRIDPTNPQAIKYFPIPTPASFPQGISAGPDGNIWFTELQGNQIGQLNPTTGHINEFAIPTSGVNPEEITSGSDGNLWFTEGGYITNFNNYQTASNIGQVVVAAVNPDLALTGTADSSVAIGSTVTYSFTVTNNGSTTATNVMLVDTPPAGATIDSTNGNVSPLTGEVAIPLSDLAAGASTSVSIVVTPGAPGEIKDSAEVSMGQDDLTPTDNSVTLTTNVTAAAAADLVLSGKCPTEAAFGSDVTYTLTVQNAGGTLATNVMLIDLIPVGAQIKDSGGGVLKTPRDLVFQLGSLAAGASTSVTVVLTAPTDTSQTPLVNDASVSMDQTDPNPNNNSVSLSTELAGTVGTGCQAHKTEVLLRFAGPVDPAWARNLHNYRLVALEGRSRRMIRLRSARFNAATNTVTLKPLHQPNMHDLFQLTVFGAGVRGPTDAATSPAGGRSGSGGPGGNLVITIGIQDLLTRGTSPTDLRNYKLLLAKQTAEMKRLGLE
jgi:uncharacterized repeat protein (TIGR01451 family)